MNYYYDCEFSEGTKKTFFGKTKPTIDLISIGIVAEDIQEEIEGLKVPVRNREYYAISKDFNLKEAWNRYDEKVEIMSGDMRNRFPNGRKYKEYWIRENVLKPIMIELQVQYNKDTGKTLDGWEYKDFKFLINKYGKTNKQIAEEVKDFVSRKDILYSNYGIDVGGSTYNLLRTYDGRMRHLEINGDTPKLYGYYSAYDHVALCWLFGKMIDLPNGFPMYTIDLKQMFDEKVSSYDDRFTSENESFDSKLKSIKNKGNYPQQTNEHNALADARWNKQLHKFLKSI